MTGYDPIGGSIYTVDKLIVGGTVDKLIVGGEPDVIRLILIGKKYIYQFIII